MSDAPPSPSPPPPPPTPPVTPPTKKTPPLAHFGAVALLVVAVLPQLFLTGDDRGIYTMSYRLGRMIGAAVFGLLVAALIWWIVRRTRPKEARPSWSPWIFLIAAGVAFVSGFANVAQRNVEAVQEFGSPYEGPANQYFIEPPGYVYRELSASRLESLKSEFLADPAAAEAIDELDARQVVQGNQPAGAVVVFLMATPPEAWEESRAGFVRGVEESGQVDLEASTIGGVDAMSGSAPSGSFVFLFDRNMIVQAFGFDEQTAQDIAEAQAPAFKK